MKKFITYNQSLDILNSIKISSKSTQKLFVSDTLNRVLAQNIVALENSPAFETSGMDGYAFKHNDLSLGKLKIIDHNPAGSVVESVVTTGTCITTLWHK